MKTSRILLFILLLVLVGGVVLIGGNLWSKTPILRGYEWHCVRVVEAFEPGATYGTVRETIRLSGTDETPICNHRPLAPDERLNQVLASNTYTLTFGFGRTYTLIDFEPLGESAVAPELEVGAAYHLVFTNSQQELFALYRKEKGE